MELQRENEAVAVPAEVLRGIRKAQADNHINKYSVHQVVVSAMRLGERDALEWLMRNHVRYLDGVFNGFFAEEE
ncbi:MAG: hypothetical protein QOI57_2839 [Rubrobacteraceae bacterium]|jgi:hypothetical protein|nr:hypothetical protein [Rubrobacteraceae bacterium]